MYNNIIEEPYTNDIIDTNELDTNDILDTNKLDTNDIIDTNELDNIEYEYDKTIDHRCPIEEQPQNILIPLKKHQLSCLYKAKLMEQNENIYYDIKKGDNDETDRLHHSLINRLNKEKPYYGKINISTNIGIIGDIVGFGKTLIALSIIDKCKLEDIYINNNKTISYNNPKTYSYFKSSCINPLIPKIDEIIKSTLVIVPRGPVYIQWLKTIKEKTKLKYLEIPNLTFIKKHLPPNNGNNIKEIIDFYNQYDLVLIKNTTLELFISHYRYFSLSTNINHTNKFIKNWSRIIIDEAHDIMNKIPSLSYYQLWLISATYEKLINRFLNNNSPYYITDENINYLLVKCSNSYIKESFDLPIPIEKYYRCKLSRYINAIKNLLSSSILEKINANDISGAIKDLGGKNETEEDMVKLISNELIRDIANKEKEIKYIEGLEIPIENKENRLKNSNNELLNLNNKLKYLKERITELSNKTCSICMDNMNDPIMLECTHSYCGKCLINWINVNRKCPDCRNIITPNSMVAIINDEKKKQNENDSNYNKIIDGVLSKEETLLQIIKNNINGKFLVFSKYDNGFTKIINIMEKNNINYSELKGNTSHMMNILDKFKKGDFKVILLNTKYAGSGIDISFATDVVIFHSMGIDKNQAIGRAQRVGRENQLNIHNLCYDHEMR